MVRATPRKIVVLRPGALGDCVAAFPVLQSLAAARPRAEVLAIGSAVFRLAAEAGLATDWMAFDDVRLLGLFAEGGTSDVFADCGLCICYLGGDESLLKANLAASGARQVLPWPAHPAGGMHVVDHLLASVEAAGLAVASRHPELTPQEGWLDEGRALLDSRGLGGDFVAIHPGSGGRPKQWGARRFAALAQRLGRPVAWLLGPAEEEDEGLREIGRQVGALVEPTTTTALAGVLASCRVYVGNDSGVSHLAAALGAPTVAIFGPTDPAVWAPRGERVRVLGGPGQGGFDGVSVERVGAAADQMSETGQT